MANTKDELTQSGSRLLATNLTHCAQCITVKIVLNMGFSISCYN